MLAMPTTPAVSVQLELDQPASGIDRTVFAPGTVLACFAEQSRTTFPMEGAVVSGQLAARAVLTELRHNRSPAARTAAPARGG